MPLRATVPAPEWVEYEAKNTSGLDLMGLRLPVLSAGNSLLNGVTTITPTVRYLAFRSWLLLRYMRAVPRPPDRLQDFVLYARHAEAAFALANLLRSRNTGGLIGSRKGGRKLAAEGELLIMEPLADQPAVAAYARPSDQLRLTKTRDPKVPVRMIEHDTEPY